VNSHRSGPSSSTRRRFAAAAAALIVTVALAACGGSSSSAGAGVSPAAYAKALCDAVAPFERDIANRQSALDPTKIKNATQGKAALEGFLVAIASDTSTAASRLHAAGTPNVTHGTQIARAFAALFNRLKTTLGTAAQQARALPTATPTAFKAAATQLGQSVRTSMSDLGSGLTQLKSPALETAAKKVRDCQTLGG
jgi:hypothetical protein